MNDEIASCFESLGDNCEFGFYQRSIGIEQLGLLRWAGIRLRDLIIALGEDFLISSPEIAAHLAVEGSTNEFMLKVPALGWSGHTFMHRGDGDEQKICEKQVKVFRFLTRRLLEQLEQSERIFVFRQNDPIVDDSIFILHDALNWYGQNTLLWVCEPEYGHRPGSVHWLRQGLLKGYTERLSLKTNGTLFSAKSWANILGNAYNLWNAVNGHISSTPSRTRKRYLTLDIKFNASGNCGKFLKEGWSRPEADFTWIDKAQAIMEIDKPSHADDYGLRLKVAPFRPDGLMKQPMDILANGHVVARYTAVTDGVISCIFPARLMEGESKLRLTFQCSGGLSPHAARVGGDKRELSIRFFWLRLFVMRWE